MFNLLHGISNQELFGKHRYNPRIPKEMVPRAPILLLIIVCLKSTSAIKIATKKNTDDFCFEGKLSRAIAKSTPFPVSKDEWDTKEDTGKSMKNALYILWYAKRHLLG